MPYDLELFPTPIAESVRAVVTGEHTDASRILNRECEISDAFVRRLVRESVFSWEGRTPRKVRQFGNFEGATDLDLFSVLVPLYLRHAVIEIPEYENRRQTRVCETERKIGTQSFGNIVGLVSHKKAFSFSVRIVDRTIVAKNPVLNLETCGAYRNYMIVDVNGDWYSSWQQISWDTLPKEREFFEKIGILKDGKVGFFHYVHPNRRQSIYGAPYLLLKLLAKRLHDEQEFYRGEVRRLTALGITVCTTHSIRGKTVAVGPKKKIEVSSMEIALDTQGFRGEYTSVPQTNAGMQFAHDRVRRLRYTLIPLVQFVTRADEAAYFLHGEHNQYIAPWMQECVWEKDWKASKRSKKVWNRMHFTKEAALRYRVYNTTQTVAA